jgi:hypothetical protein
VPRNGSLRKLGNSSGGHKVKEEKQEKMTGGWAGKNGQLGNCEIHEAIVK